MALGERIIFVPFLHAFGGVERLILGLSRHLHEQGCAHEVLCFEQTIDLASHAGWPLYVTELKSARNPLAEARALGKYLQAAGKRGSPPPLVFDLKGAFYAGAFAPRGYCVHLTDPPSLLPSDISKHAPSATKTLPHSQRPRRGSLPRLLRAELVHRANRRGVARAGQVIVMTQVIAEEIRRLYGVSLQIVRPGVPPLQGSTEGVAKRLALAEGEPVRLLSVSRLEANKRIDWILQALAEAPPLENWALDVVGDGSQAAALKELAQRLELEQKVIFHGRVSDKRLEEIYGAAHLFLMPAVQGYGLPALEALAAGIPVILHHESGVAEILNGTPWAEVISSAPQSLGLAMSAMFARLRAGAFEGLERPEVPTEDDWARRICQACGWT